MNRTRSFTDCLQAWRALLGAENVLAGADIQRQYPGCTTGVNRDVPAVLRVRRSEPLESLEALEEGKLQPLLKLANTCRVPIHPISTGHNWGYGTWLPPRSPCAVLDLSALTRISDYDPELGVITVEPGVTQAHLASFLLAHGDAHLVPVTGGGPSCSILGNALERGYGVTPHTDHFAAVVSLQAILPSGARYRSPLRELASNSPPVPYKWGLGSYLDGVFTQSGLAIVTSMTLNLARRPASTKVFLFTPAQGASVAELTDVVREVRSRLNGLVGGINILNARRALSMAVSYPWDLRDSSGTLPNAVIQDLQGKFGIGDWTVFGTLYGTHRTSAAAQADIKALARGMGGQLRFLSLSQARGIERVVERFAWPALRNRLGRRTRLLRMAVELANGVPNEAALPLAYWRSRTAPGAAGAMDPARDGCGLVWYAPLIAMHGERVREFVAFVTRVMTQYGMEPLITLTTLNEQCLDSSVPILFNRSVAHEVERAHACYRALVQEGLGRGFPPYRLPVGLVADALPSEGTHADLYAIIKDALDPGETLSPGRYRASPAVTRVSAIGRSHEDPAVTVFAR